MECRWCSIAHGHNPLTWEGRSPGSVGRGLWSNIGVVLLMDITLLPEKVDLRGVWEEDCGVALVFVPRSPEAVIDRKRPGDVGKMLKRLPLPEPTFR